MSNAGQRCCQLWVNAPARSNGLAGRARQSTSETRDVKILNLLSPQEPDVKPALRLLGNTGDRITARKMQMLVDLVGFLEEDGPARLAFAHIYQHEIWLTPANQYNRAMVKITVDWPDYGPLRDGMPAMHYRLQITRRAGAAIRDGRSPDIKEIRRLIFERFGWSRANDDSDAGD